MDHRIGNQGAPRDCDKRASPLLYTAYMSAIRSILPLRPGFFDEIGCLTFYDGAPDAGDSSAIPSVFLRLSIFPVGRRSAARPSAGNANR